MQKWLAFFIGMAVSGFLAVIIISTKPWTAAGLDRLIGIAMIGLVFVFTFLLVLAFYKKISSSDGKPGFHTPAILFVLGAGCFLLAGILSNKTLQDTTMDIALRDTYFVVSGWTVVISVICMFLFFGAVYHFFQRITGRRMNRKMGVIHFGISFVSTDLLFFLYDSLRISSAGKTDGSDPSGWAAFYAIRQLHVYIGVIAGFAIAAQILFLVNFFYSVRKAN